MWPSIWSENITAWVFSPLVYTSTVLEKNEAKISKLSAKFDIKTVTLDQSFN